MGGGSTPWKFDFPWELKVPLGSLTSHDGGGGRTLGSLTSSKEDVGDNFGRLTFQGGGWTNYWEFDFPGRKRWETPLIV